MALTARLLEARDARALPGAAALLRAARPRTVLVLGGNLSAARELLAPLLPAGAAVAALPAAPAGGGWAGELEAWLLLARADALLLDACAAAPRLALELASAALNLKRPEARAFLAPHAPPLEDYDPRAAACEWDARAAGAA